MGHAANVGRGALRGIDNFFVNHGPALRRIAQVAAPALAEANPALAAGVAAIGQAAGGYAHLRQQLGGDV